MIDTDHVVATRQLKKLFLLVKQVQYDVTSETFRHDSYRKKFGTTAQKKSSNCHWSPLNIRNIAYYAGSATLATLRYGNSLKICLRAKRPGESALTNFT